MIEVIDKVLLFDDHQSSKHKKALSCSQLLGATYYASQALKGRSSDKPVDAMMRRSSAIGTGFHMRAEQAMHRDPKTVDQEVFAERYIKEYDCWISGKFDIIYDGHIMDFKTGYGKEFSKEKLEKAVIQMSIYRWLNEDDYDIDDLAYVLFVSQTMNVKKSYPIQLWSIEETSAYIYDRLKEITEHEDYVDCKDNVKYDPCAYCSLNCDHIKPKEFT